MEKDQLIQSRHYTAWELIKLYWKSEQRYSAYFFLFIVMLMTMLIIAMDVAFNYWYNFFYDALQAYNKAATIRLLIIFTVMATVYIILAVYRFYLSQLFGLRWRRWLTEQFINRWLHKRSYYYLENFDEKTDNPDQRIQEDVGTLIINTIDLTIGLVSSVTTFFAFIYILWKLSGVMHVHIGGYILYIPGYLLWVGVLYAVFGSWITIKIGRPLVPLNFEQQSREATFRYAAIDLRSHAEHVALYRGEQHQSSILNRLFGRVLDNWYFIIMRQKLLLWFTAGYNQISVLLPLVAALPNYFEKVFLLGGLMQSLQAFGRVQDSLSYIVNSYTQIATWQAITRRLTTFLNHMNDADKHAIEENQLIFSKHKENSIYIKNVTIKTPRGEVLLTDINEIMQYGRHYLIIGPSGIGKSTFVRTIAGIWPYAAGEITLPENQKMMYLPQKPYMPIGTLAEAILFPDKRDPELEKDLKQILKDCHLENLISRLYDTASWAEQLSPGELQRVTFARVLLHKPDWVFLDESTSMLDLANEEYLYKLMQSRLPDCSIVSVGHRPSLNGFHNEIIDVTKYSIHAF